MSFTGLGSVRIVKTCDLGHSFSLYGPPSRQITYIFQLHHAVNNMNTTINFVLAVSAEHQEL